MSNVSEFLQLSGSLMIFEKPLLNGTSKAVREYTAGQNKMRARAGTYWRSRIALWAPMLLPQRVAGWLLSSQFKADAASRVRLRRLDSSRRPVLLPCPEKSIATDDIPRSARGVIKYITRSPLDFPPP